MNDCFQIAAVQFSNENISFRHIGAVLENHEN